VDGNETWLTRLFAAAMARRSKEAIRRASASTKPSSSESGNARLTYPYRSAVSPSKSFAENDFERAATADQMWEALGAAAARMHSHADFGLAESRVFARRETHVTGEDELATAAAHAASDLCDTDHRGLCETHERIHQNREAGRPHGCRDVPRLAGQIKVGEIEVGNRALEHDDAQPLTGVHPKKQILEASKDRLVKNVERRIIEHDPPVRRCFLDDSHVRR
jgi:hypothetical protein